jgi:hypothetical protein
VLAGRVEVQKATICHCHAVAHRPVPAAAALTSEVRAAIAAT